MLTKKGINQLGSKFNESAGSKVSSFALKQMEKFGWKEGQGLGKNEDGIVKHIKAVKKEENTGIGRDAVALQEATSEWWHDAFSTALKGVHKSKKIKKKKKADGTTDESRDAPTFEQLFEATGGARMGMRARASQKGKILRTEQSMGPAPESAANMPKNIESADADLKSDITNEEVMATFSAQSKSKKKKRKRTSEDEDNVVATTTEEGDEDTPKESEKKKAKKEKKEKKEKKKKAKIDR